MSDIKLEIDGQVVFTTTKDSGFIELRADGWQSLYDSSNSGVVFSANTPPVTNIALPPVTNTAPQPDFSAAVQAAWDSDKELFWTGGDVTLKTPIVLTASVNKLGFKILASGAKITCDFNDGTKAAISVVVAKDQSGKALPNISVRNWFFQDFSVSGNSPFLGALYLECLTNASWIYTGKISNLKVDGHVGHAVTVSGSVFEFELDSVGSTGGLGGFRAIERGQSASDPTGADTDRGLPSAMYIYMPNFRDFNGNAIELTSSTPYRECFDLTIRDGYLVTGLGTGYAVSAPSGITEISGTGIENVNGGAAIYIGYRGGSLINVRGTNPVAGATLNPKKGMAYLVDAYLTGGTLEMRGCSVQNEVSGSGVRLANVNGDGTGKVYLDPTRSSAVAADIDGNTPNANFHIVTYSPKP